jgi:glycosyltransferase involved in cell wall biosynthesis
MASILIVTPTIPFPVRANGLTVRANPLVVHLAKRHDVHLLAIDDGRKAASELLADARTVCATATMVPPVTGRLAIRAQLLRALTIRPAPPHRWLHAITPATLREAGALVSRHACTSVLAFGGISSQSIVALERRLPDVRRVIDWVDSPSLHVQRDAEHAGLHAAALVEETAIWERRVNASASHAIYISAKDAAYGNTELGDRISVIPNGLIDDFPVDDASYRPVPFTQLPRLTLGFLGNMGYAPNHLAAMHLVQELLPALQSALPQVELRVKVIGRAPHPDLAALAGPSLEVTGAVDSIWPQMNDVDVFVFPMRIGAGMQNKVIEALRASRPVVVSSVCAGGLPADEDSGVIVADDAHEIASVLHALLTDSARVAAHTSRGLAYARARTWGPLLDEYEALLVG